MNIQEKLVEYLKMNKEISTLRKQQLELKKKVGGLEVEIQKYMTDNDMESIVLNEGQIVLYERKINQTFKKENIVEKLTEKLQDSQKAEELTQSILKNNKYVVEEKIKAVIRKK
jgi:hypothetical protein